MYMTSLIDLAGAETPEEIAAKLAPCCCSNRTQRMIDANHHYPDCATHLRDDIATALRAAEERGARGSMRWLPEERWHEDDGPALWARFEPDDPWPYDVHFGSPLGSDWPDEDGLTHYLLVPSPPAQDRLSPKP